MAPQAALSKKPSGAVDISKLGMGLEKAPEAEVSGHAHGFYTCWNCGGVAWVNNDLNGYICPYCYAVCHTGF
jgi:hypothetical protein